jgi:hypothetical protein
MNISIFSDDQRVFLATEFGFSEEEIKNMTLDEAYENIYLPCADLEAELLPKNESDPCSSRCEMAVSIVDIMPREFDKERQHVSE